MTRDDIKEAAGKIANEILQEKLDLEREYKEAEARRLLDMQIKQADFTREMQRQLRECPQPSVQPSPLRGAGGMAPNPAGGFGLAQENPTVDAAAQKITDLFRELDEAQRERNRLRGQVQGLEATVFQLRKDLRIARDECFFLEPVEVEQTVTFLGEPKSMYAFHVPSSLRGAR